jgi:DNA-binding MarR family transcriptional regulator
VDAERQQLVDRVLDAGRELGAAALFFHTAVAAHFGFGPTDTKTLDLLQRAGPLTPKQMSEMTGLAPASVTGIIDRLERKGFVQRLPHPDDGRRLLIGFDPRAFAVMAPMFEGIVQSMTDMVEPFTDDQLRFLADVWADAARRQLGLALGIADADPNGTGGSGFHPRNAMKQPDDAPTATA